MPRPEARGPRPEASAFGSLDLGGYWRMSTRSRGSSAWVTIFSPEILFLGESSSYSVTGVVTCGETSSHGDGPSLHDCCSSRPPDEPNLLFLATLYEPTLAVRDIELYVAYRYISVAMPDGSADGSGSSIVE